MDMVGWNDGTMISDQPKTSMGSHGLRMGFFQGMSAGWRHRVRWAREEKRREEKRLLLSRVSRARVRGEAGRERWKWLRLDRR